MGAVVYHLDAVDEHAHDPGRRTLPTRTRRGRGAACAPSPAPRPTAAPAIVGLNRIDVTAKGAQGGITIARAVLGARRLTVDATTNINPPGAKGVVLTDGAVLTTDPAVVGSAGSAGDVVVKGTRGTGTGAAVAVRAATIQSGRDVLLAAPRPGDDACLESATLIAHEGLGIIDFVGVRGTVFVDDMTVLQGRLRGAERVSDASCPP